MAATAAGPYVDIPAGASVGLTSTFISSSAPAQTIAFQSLGNHVLDFRFFNESTAVINYGMLGLSTSGPSGFPAVFNWWAYENSGLAFTQALPEASSFSLLSVGVVVLSALSLRRQRRQRQAAA